MFGEGEAGSLARRIRIMAQPDYNYLPCYPTNPHPYPSHPPTTTIFNFAQPIRRFGLGGQRSGRPE